MGSVLSIIGWALFAVCAFTAIGWALAIRRAETVQHQTVNLAMLLALSVVAVPLFGLSPLNLLWMVPAALVVTFLSFLPPFSLLSKLGAMYWDLLKTGRNS